jgi:protein-tyrosine-phosphatase
MAGKNQGPKKNILFVCTGNTCRSPMAEGLFGKAVEGRSGWVVKSAGVAASAGSKASRETLLYLESRGIHMKNFRSQPVSAQLLREADAVFVMTESHLFALEDDFPDFADKYYLVCDFIDPAVESSRCDVPDPIGMGQAAYEKVAKLFDAAFPGISRFLEAGK